jgi:TPR repeat protein
MRIYNRYRTIGVSLIALAVALGAYCAQAGGEDQPAATLGSVQQLPSLRAEGAPDSERAVRESRVQTALLRMEAEARKGNFSAQLRLARIYSQGREAPRNEARAFFYYRQIADQNADIDIYHPAARFVAEAFRALAGYYRVGVPALNLAPDRARSSQLLQQSASYFQDPMAQFTLGKMYLTGDGVARNPKIGVHWLVNASRRRYAPAQAVLGDLLWEGKDVKSSPGEGLALLALAKDNASPEDASWIAALYDKAMARANESQVKAAEKVLARFEKLYRLRAGGTIQILRPNRPGPEKPNSQDLKSQAEVLVSEEGAREAGALLGLFGGEVIPAPDRPEHAAAQAAAQHAIAPGIFPGVGPAADAAPDLQEPVPQGLGPQELLTGYTPKRAGGIAPAGAVSPEEPEAQGRSLSR